MSTRVEKMANGRLRIRLGQAEAELSVAEVKTLLVQIIGQLAPGAASAADPAKHFDDFVKKLAGANDVGIETLIRGAHDDDVLVLLKSVEADEAVAGRFYRNMSERSRKMYREDLAFRFNDGIPAGDINRASKRLSEQARALESEGLLNYGN